MGGRQHRSPPATRGGGYPDICTQTEVPLSDPRMRELKQMALPSVWMSIAELVGFESFISLWKILDENFKPKYHRNCIRVDMPGFSRFERYQRNGYIRRVFTETGLKAKHLRNVIKNDMGVELSVRQIDRIIQKVRKK